MAGVFLSHASADRAAAAKVADWLRADGHTVFLDSDLTAGITVGQEWKQRLYRELRRADAVVCLVTGAYVASNWCAAEVGIADSLGCLLLPLRIEAGVLHPLMERLQYADFTADPESAGARVIGVLRGVDGAGGSGWRDGENPYPGLTAFTARFSRMFFGRAPEIRELSARLRSAARPGGGILAVAGASGCGKSSLLQAGLLPTLDDDGTWLVTSWQPGSDPLTGLARALALTANRHGRPWSLAEVRRKLDTEEQGLRWLAEELLVARAGPEGSTLLLAVDQAEELFTRATRRDQRQIAVLLAGAVAGPARVAMTVRSEFLDDLRGLPSLDGVTIDSYLLKPLSTDMLRLAIEGPARIAGLRLEPDLTARLIADTDTGEALPLLAFVLQQLAGDLTRGDTLTLGHYLGLGGVQGALARHADAALIVAGRISGLTAEQVVAGLVRLVTVDESGRRGRRRVAHADLSEPERAAVGVFVDQRILVAGTDDDGHRWVTAAHEAFLTAWPPLDAAIAGRTAELHAARSVEQAAAEWAAAGRPYSHLWDEVRFTGALAALGPSAADVNPAARAFLDATQARVRAEHERAEAARHRARRLRYWVNVGISGLTVMALAAALATTQWVAASRSEADAQRARLLAVTLKMVAQADAARADGPGAALQLGTAAYRIQPGPETAAGLVNTLTGSRYAGTLTGPSGPVRRLAFAPDGRTLTAAGNEISRWDLARRSESRVSNEVGLFLAASADGRTMATTGETEEGVQLWDLSDPAAPRRVGGALSGIADFVTLSPDGRRMATGRATEGTVAVLLWDLTDRADPKLIGKPLAASGPAVFSPDGRTLVTNTNDGRAGLLLWDLTGGAAPRRAGRAETGGNGDVTAVAFAPGGRTLAAGDSDSSVRLWRIGRSEPGRPFRTLAGEGSAVTSVAFAPDGRALVAGTLAKATLLWDLTRDGAGGDRTTDRLAGHNGAVTAVAFAADGNTVATGSADKTVMLWDLTARTTVRDLRRDSADLGGYGAFSPDRRTLATMDIGDGVRLWDMTGGVPRPLGGPLPGGDDLAPPLVFSPDGRTLVTAARRSGVLLWDLSDRTAPHRLGEPLGDEVSFSLPVVFSPDGRTLAAATSADGVRLWDLTDRSAPRGLGRPLSVQKQTVRSLGLSPDGRILATGSDDSTVVLWDVRRPAAPRPLGQPLTGHNGTVNAVAFAPDGRTLATAGDDATTRLWDVTDLGSVSRVGLPLTGHESAVQAVGFAPDGRTLATGGGDNRVLLWDLTDRGAPRRLGPSLEGGSGLSSVSFAPDSATLAAGNTSDVRVWDLTALHALRADPLRAACARGGGLDRAAWAVYAPDFPFQDVCRTTPR